MKNSSPKTSTQDTTAYYRALFPKKLITTLFHYSGTTPHLFREVGMVNSDMMYARSAWYNNQDLGSLFGAQYLPPVAIEMGPLMMVCPDANGIMGSAPIEKEIVFDIDADEYNSVRRCCSSKSACVRCWKLVIVAGRSIDRCMRQQFGFTDIIWVYSGGRGLHAWVSDLGAMASDDDFRASLVEYMRQPDNARGMTQLRKHVLEESIALIEEYVLDQDLLGSYAEHCTASGSNSPTKAECNEKGWRAFLTLCRDSITDEDAGALLERWLYEENKTAASRWKDVKSTRGFDRGALACRVFWPRIDVPVTTTMKHMLKSPFSVHKSSGRVSIPVDINHERCWDIASVQVNLVDLLHGEECKDKDRFNESVIFAKTYCDKLIEKRIVLMGEFYKNIKMID